MKTLKVNPVEIGREEAFELCNYELPTKKTEHIISRSTLETSQIVYKENGKFFIAELKVE